MTAHYQWTAAPSSHHTCRRTLSGALLDLVDACDDLADEIEANWISSTLQAETVDDLDQLAAYAEELAPEVLAHPIDCPECADTLGEMFYQVHRVVDLYPLDPEAPFVEAVGAFFAAIDVHPARQLVMPWAPCLEVSR